MRLENNLETAIAFLGQDASLVSPEDPYYQQYVLSKNTAVKAIKQCNSENKKRQESTCSKKEA